MTGNWRDRMDKSSIQKQPATGAAACWRAAATPIGLARQARAAYSSDRRQRAKRAAASRLKKSLLAPKSCASLSIITVACCSII